MLFVNKNNSNIFNLISKPSSGPTERKGLIDLGHDLEEPLQSYGLENIATKTFSESSLGVWRVSWNKASKNFEPKSGLWFFIATLFQEAKL